MATFVTSFIRLDSDIWTWITGKMIRNDRRLRLLALKKVTTRRSIQKHDSCQDVLFSDDLRK